MKKQNYVLVLFLVMCISACAQENIVDFPDTDINYQAVRNRTPGDPIENSVGFVNADGSQNTYVELKYRPLQPIYSKELGGLLFRKSDNPIEMAPETTGGKISFLDQAGRYRICDNFAVWFIFPIPNTQLVLSNDGLNIQIIDVSTCNVIKTIVPDVEHSMSMSVSSSGTLIAYDERDLSSLHGMIYLVDVDSGEMVSTIQDGVNPSLSPNEKLIAFVGEDGIYIANIDGTNRQKITPLSLPDYAHWPSLLPAPLWSPDGKLLIYHKCLDNDCRELIDFSIFKFNLETWTEEKIVDNGLFPVWVK